jgi:hypothetical protein
VLVAIPHRQCPGTPGVGSDQLRLDLVKVGNLDRQAGRISRGGRSGNADERVVRTRGTQAQAAGDIGSCSVAGGEGVRLKRCSRVARMLV